MITYEQKEVWAAALRSGNYKQGLGQLKRTLLSGNKEYCCLGVLEEVCGVPRRSAPFLERDVLPDVVQERLSTMNDGKSPNDSLKYLRPPPSVDFNGIADYIDEHFESWKLIYG